MLKIFLKKKNNKISKKYSFVVKYTKIITKKHYNNK